MPHRPRRTLTLLVPLVPLACWLGPGLAMAQPLTLQEAVDRALERHPALLAAGEATGAAREGVGEVESALWPRLSLVGAYRYSQPVGELTIDTGLVPPGATEPLTISREIGTPHNASIGLQAGWRAFDWGVRRAGVEAAEAAVRAAQDDESLRAVDIAYAVRVAYLAGVFYATVDEITVRSLETARRELEDREARLRAGVGSDLDVASASARVAELEARQVDVQTQQAQAHNTLRLLLGLEPGAALELVDDFDTVESGVASTEAAEHPALERFEALAEALEWQAEAMDRSFWPTLDLFSTAAYQFPRTFVETEEAGFAYTVGLSITWELFDGFYRDHREDELLSQVRATTHTLEATQEELDRTRLDAESRRDAAAARLAAAERQLEAAETYLRVARSAYSAGAGTTLEVMAAEGAVDGARLAEAQARFERAAATADLLRARGTASVTSTPRTPQPNE